MLFAGGLLRFVEFLVARGAGLPQVAMLLLYRLPYLMVFTIPIALLLAVLVVFLRLSGDSELTAARAAGLSLYQLLPAPMTVALAAFVACAALSLYAKPWGSFGFKRVLFELTRQQVDLAFEEQAFVDGFKDMVVYTGRIPAKGRLEDVFISDEREGATPNAVLAQRGRILSDPDRGLIVLRLLNGTIFRVSPDLKSAEALRFQTYDLSMAFGQLEGPYRILSRTRSDKGFGELLADMRAATATSKERKEALAEVHRRLALPFACLVLALIAVPLGATSRLERGWGIAFGLGVYILYYLLWSGAWSMVETGWLPAWGIWLPNLLVGLLAWGLLIGAARRGKLALPRRLGWWRIRGGGPR
jgi:lipopolysaccharide export system permease protein